jgi:multiple sugar transport system substrate-binding protein
VPRFPIRLSRTPYALLSLLLGAAFVLSACSSGSSEPRPATPVSSNNQPANTPATAANPAAQAPAAAQQPVEKGSSQASGDIDPRTSDTPAAPVVARSRTTGRPITLEIWLTDWEQSTQHLFNDELVPAFEAANPDIAVNLQYLDWRVFSEKLIAAHAGGVLPDVFQAGAQFVAPVATKGMALPIDDKVQAWGQKDDYYDSAWNTVTYQGKTYGIPVLTAPQTLMYRKDMVPGGQAPKTWDDLEQLALQSTKRDGDKFQVTGLNLHPIPEQFVWFLFQNGGDVFTTEGKVTVNSPEAVEALDFFSKLFNQDKVSSKSTISAPTANVGAMASNLVAMQLGNQLTVRDFKDNNPAKKDELVVADPIQKKVQVTTNWTDWLAISKQSRNPDAAWKFVQFIADKDNLLKYNETMYFIPPRKSLRTTGYMNDPQLQQFVKIMEQYGRTINTSPAALEVYGTILKNAVEDAVYQKKSSKQALDDAAKSIERALRR